MRLRGPGKNLYHQIVEVRQSQGNFKGAYAEMNDFCNVFTEAQAQGVFQTDQAPLEGNEHQRRLCRYDQDGKIQIERSSQGSATDLLMRSPPNSD